MSTTSGDAKSNARYWESILPCVRLKVNNTEFSFSIPNDKALWVANDVANREPEVYRWIDSCLDEKSLFIDVGANFGLYTLYAALKAQCRVLAFEPHFASYYVLSRNIILNNLSDKISLYPLAIANSPTTRSLFSLHDITAGKALNTLVPSLDSHIKIQLDNEVKELAANVRTTLQEPFYQPVVTTSLDAFLSQNADTYDFKKYKNIALKIDIDGLDFLVLAGAMQSLSSINNIIVEYLPNQVEMHSLIPGLAKQYGFKVIEQSDCNLILSRS
tara:strand:+ start:25 stop:843 length:819 start_codon:yes stop_codon:yes gene_type:complete